MPLRPDLTSARTDNSLDEFRDRVAEVHLDGRTVGYLATRVDAEAKSLGGRLWWTKWSEPREVVGYLLSRTDDASPLPEWDDGVDDESGSIVAELRTGTTTYTDHRQAGSGSWEDAEDYTYTLLWLDGDQRTQMWSRYGFEDETR